MQYRSFGKDNWQVSALGIGAMRFAGDMHNSGDARNAIDLLRYSIDLGINYVDTAYIYHGGKSEGIVGRALKDGYRDKVRVANKSPLHIVKNGADFVRILDEQLQRMDMDYIDYYMFHGIGAAHLDTIIKEELLLQMEKAKEAGKIGHIGFSFHDNAEAFKKIVSAYPGWEFCMLQYNYMDINRQGGTEAFDYAAAKNLPVIIMEPLLGGRLANPPKDVAQLMENFQVQRSAADWALSWLWHHPSVVTILSGMATREQLDENCRIAEKATPECLSDAELAFVNELRVAFSKRTVIPCTRCDYCKPCPEGIPISWLLELYNDAIMFDDLNAPRFAYNNWVAEEQRASVCTACGACEDLCPQKIAVSERMPKVHEVLGGK